VEAAFLTSVTDPDSHPRLEQTRYDPTGAAGGSLLVSFLRPINWDTRGLSFSYEASSDLLRWETLPVEDSTELTTSPTVPASPLHRVTVRINGRGATNFYIRLRVRVSL
jgi:hypothetical protein